LLAGTSEKEDLAIKSWTESVSEKPKKFLSFCAVLIPLLLAVSVIGSVLNWHPVFSKLTVFFFTLNLMLIGYFSQHILKEIGKSDKIANSLQQYSKMLRAFENEKFQSVYLNHLQSQLKSNQKPAYQIVTELANCFEKLNTIANLFV